jgi:4-hydroxythreonine-4-phosphate dehydrogenase
LSQTDIFEIARPFVVPDLRVMKDVLSFTKLDLLIHKIERIQDARCEHGAIDVLDTGNMDMKQLRYKKVMPEQGHASFEYVAKVIELAVGGEIDGTVTGPSNTAAINAAGRHFSGHTEICAKLTSTRDSTKMLTHGDFRGTHVSTHVSLREACDRVKKERIIKVIDLTYAALVNFGISVPRIGVAGFNPHCGEGGLFGTEDMEEILLAVDCALNDGINAKGPIPADTVFSKLKGGMYDFVVAMCHDQGHIPVKSPGFQYDQKTKRWEGMSGVNITLGLPIVRTSVDHGTAFDKAGEGRANPKSLIEAIRLAALLSKNR